MELEKVVSMGIGMVRVNVKLPFLHSFGLRALFLVSTLQAVYGLGIIHNGIKPESVVTSDRESSFLIDWNAARYKTRPAPEV